MVFGDKHIFRFERDRPGAAHAGGIPVVNPGQIFHPGDHHAAGRPAAVLVQQPYASASPLRVPGTGAIRPTTVQAITSLYFLDRPIERHRCRLPGHARTSKYFIMEFLWKFGGAPTSRALERIQPTG